MRRIGRRTFMGAAGLGAVAAGTRPVYAQEYGSGADGAQRIGATGLAPSEALTMTVVWIPVSGTEQPASRSVRMVVYSLAGRVLAERQVDLEPFTGASLNYKPQGRGRQTVFRYVFVDEPYDDIYPCADIYDVASGITSRTIADPLG